MKKIGVLLVLSILSSVSAFAQNIRSAVSITGTDAATCTVPDPCRTFNTAISNTIVGGEVIALTSGGYGPFIVDKTLTVQAAPGIYAGITTSGGQGVGVSIPSFQTVVLRGLNIKIGTNGDAGIRFSSAGALVVDSCFMVGAGDGIFQTGDGSRLFVLDTKFIGMGNGVRIETTNGAQPAKVSIDHCRFEVIAGNAVSAQGNARVTVSNSEVHEAFVAFTANLPGIVGGVQMNIENCIAANGNIGMYVNASGLVMRVSNSIAVNNSNIGFGQGTGAVFETRSNNMVRGNLNNIVGTLTPIVGN